MKIFLSDFHLGDGKERDDFEYHQEFDDLVKKLSEDFTSIEMVLLGDVFDLIRTQKYYESDGEPFTEEKIKRIKRKVMAEILVDHAAFFETLGRFIEKPGHTFRYVVGNHDFALGLDSRLLEMIQEKFDLTFSVENYRRR